MFAKSHRFSFKKGAPRRIYSTPLFVVRYDDNEKNGLHAAVVVGKKVDKKAVGRNRIKRQLAMTIEGLIPKDTNVDIVLFAKKQIETVEKEKIREELLKVFKQIKIIT